MPSGEDRSGDRAARRPKVLSEGWEDALRAGQKEEGLGGSVEPELSIVHLLRHARAPEALAEDRLDAVWDSVDSAIADAAPIPWWRRRWTWMGIGGVAAAAAAVVLVIVMPGPPDVTTHPTVAVADDGGPERVDPPVDQAAALERQFQILAPGARDRVAAEVDDDRGQLRERLLAEALGAKGTMGGAP